MREQETNKKESAKSRRDDSTKLRRDDSGEIDGRNARSVRTMQNIAESFLELLEEGQLRPPIRDIAARAGVSERAVFRHFDDVETLFDEVAKKQIESVISRVPDLVAADAPFAERVDSYMARWCRVFEHVTPVRRAANLNEPFSPGIARRHAWARRRRASDFATLFEKELSRMNERDRGDIRDAAAALLSWTTWEHLRTQRKHSIARATAIMTRTTNAILSGRF